MVSVIEVYNSVRDICNKDQKGFVTPEVFNSFAQVAQQNVFNEMFNELVEAKKVVRTGINPGKGESPFARKQEDLSYFSFEEGLVPVAGNVIADEPVTSYGKPVDFVKAIALRTIDNDSIEIEPTADKVARMLKSLLSRPTEEFPVAIISDNILVYPDGVNGAVLRYYRRPTSRFAVTYSTFIAGDLDRGSDPTFSVSGQDFAVPHLRNCRDFDLPGHYKPEVVNEIVKMVAVRLRDTSLFNYANTEDAAE
jgi:hypothetical protein